jgi:hypothetical protein
MVEQTAAATEEAKPIMVDSAAHRRNAARAKRDEEELKQLLEEHTGGSGQEEEPSSKAIKDAPVQAKGDSKQEEESKAEAQEETSDDDLSAEEKTFKQRYADIQRYMQDKAEEHKTELEKLKGQLDSAAKNELVLPKSDKEIEAWAKKYPDVAGIVEAIADKKAQERSLDIDKRLKEVEELRVNAKREKAEAELLSMHPDFEGIRADDTFHEWAKEQPKWVQDALYENVDDAKSVSRVIDLYKADKGITTKKRNTEDKAAAKAVKARVRNTPETEESNTYLRESQINKMSTREYEKRSDEIMEAIRSGKFIYDMSK